MPAGSPRGRPVAILFLKAPLIGAAKTRLAADIGVPAAWRFYRETAQRIGGQLARRPEWDLVVAVAPRRSARHLRHGLPRLAGLPCIEQGEGNLGLRMARCLDRFAPRPRLLFGADIPGIDAVVIGRAFDLLGGSDVLFGPAEDGGFWLVGQRGPARCSRLFDGVPWSSPETLAATLRNVPRHRRAAFAETLADVDDGAAWRAWKGGSRTQL
ncbi:MAG: DUF2064 domain-containing protein [Rhodospirillaceae bacterium]|nr:DUF2064 domain-containing protein [Rhodospirillaceae bacterium]MYH38211.1 DUF2064 domain-containing protein [Rhodospirillaceae bacterium]MYK13021.1 DUF2064 domain-containing protein [Rhodospirillaceae bacterium]MYK57488.1 DUF2064 domain-containing protein [Rhodospirillaceae bacterium]